MADREKVIKGLEYCIADEYCDDCPYTDDCFEIDDKPYGEQLMRDALALLKEQEDLGTELTNAVELIHKKNERIKKLLKEQEAVEPKQVVRKQCKKEHDDGSIDYFAEWYCPHCKMLILRGYDNPSIKFCYKCGKPILWEGR